MSAELAVRSDALARWAADAHAVHQIAVSLATTSFCPRTMAGRPDEVTGAILAGRELGLDPMAALRCIDIIDGTPALRAIALRGLVQSAGHEMWVEESTDARAIVRGRRAGSANTQTSTWTIDRAKKANLAGKQNWIRHPQAMLIARATAECARLVAADVLIALPYIAEEIEDEPDMGAAALSEPVKPAKRTAQRKPTPAAPAPQPPPVPPPPAPPAEARPLVAPHRPPADADVQRGPAVDDYQEPAMSERTRRALMAAYREVGITDRAERLEHCSTWAGRRIESANDLTEAEAVGLLAFLNRLVDNAAAVERERDPWDDPNDGAGADQDPDDWPAVAQPPDGER